MLRALRAVSIGSGLFVTLGFMVFSENARAGEVSCTCEELSCKTCEIETDVTFYTAKCGPANSRVKSCKKPTCVPATNFEQCMADLGQGKQPIALNSDGKIEKVKRSAGDVELVDRQPAATAEIGVSVGAVTGLEGAAKIKRTGSQDLPVSKGLKIYERDQIDTERAAKVRIDFSDGNILIVQPSSSVLVESQSGGAKKGPHKTLLNLMYGKLRAKVDKKNKYDNKANTFQVRTRAAVAGVRGTDFITGFDPGATQWTTEVKTLEGIVEFGGDGSENKIQIEALQTGVFTIASLPKEVSPLIFKNVVQAGELRKGKALTDQEAAALDAATGFANSEIGDVRSGEKGSEDADKGFYAKRGIASADEVCRNPTADLNQCSFERSGSACIRRRCNAGGVWADPTPLSSRSMGLCPASGSRVGDCGQY